MNQDPHYISKRLLKECQEKIPDSLKVFYKHWNKDKEPTLQRCQHAIAKEYEFNDWKTLIDFYNALEKLPATVNRSHCIPSDEIANWTLKRKNIIEDLDVRILFTKQRQELQSIDNTYRLVNSLPLNDFPIDFLLGYGSHDQHDAYINYGENSRTKDGGRKRNTPLLSKPQHILIDGPIASGKTVFLQRFIDENKYGCLCIVVDFIGDMSRYEPLKNYTNAKFGVYRIDQKDFLSNNFKRPNQKCVFIFNGCAENWPLVDAFMKQYPQDICVYGAQFAPCMNGNELTDKKYEFITKFKCRISFRPDVLENLIYGKEILQAQRVFPGEGVITFYQQPVTHWRIHPQSVTLYLGNGSSYRVRNLLYNPFWGRDNEGEFMSQVSRSMHYL